MLVYHPAYDMNHGMFRMLRLLDATPDQVMKWDTFRILDLYYLFPYLLSAVSLPREFLKAKRTLEKRSSKYNRVPSPKVFIQQMVGIHESVARSLVGKGFLDAEAFEKHSLKRTDKPLPTILLKAFENADDDHALVDLLACQLAALPLSGRGGLKERTGLLEHRYDAV